MNAAAVNPSNSNGPVYLSIRQAASAFRRDRKSLARRIRREGLAPAAERHGFPVYRLRDLLHVELRLGEQDPNKMNPFERQAHFRAESELQKVNAARRELVRREDVDAEWARMETVITSELDRMVDEFRRDFGASPSILRKIREKVDVMRGHLQH